MYSTSKVSQKNNSQGIGSNLLKLTQYHLRNTKILTIYE